MDRLKTLEIFKEVAERGSFVKAGDALGLSRSVVSRSVADLEAFLGARLFQRDTRKLALTQEGASALDKASALLQGFDELSRVKQPDEQEPSGLIRLNAPMAYGQQRLGPPLASFMAAYPKVQIDLQLTDRFVDLVDENVDVALRVARELKSTLIARRVAWVEQYAYASPAYLAKYGEPVHPSELARHHCMSYSASVDRQHWSFFNTKTGEKVRVTVKGALNANNGTVLAAAAASGAGVIYEPEFIVQASNQAHLLKRLLVGWHAEPIGVYLVYPSRRYQTPRVRKLIDHLATALAEPSS